MRVTLLTEGTYPHAHGGVSVWCDQLVQGMPDVEFDVIAVTGTGNEELAWQLPGWVRKVTTAPLWGPAAPGKPPRGRELRRFLDAYERFLHSVLDPVYATHFGTELYGFADFARRGLLGPALRGEAALRTLQEVWTRPYLPTAAAEPTLHDALHATDLLEHALRPLVVEAPSDGVTHAVSGGLAALPGLIAAQQHNVPFLLTEHGIYLRERYLGYRTGPYRWPVKALLLGFYRMLAEESYARAALVTPATGTTGAGRSAGARPRPTSAPSTTGWTPSSSRPPGPSPSCRP